MYKTFVYYCICFKRHAFATSLTETLQEKLSFKIYPPVVWSSPSKQFYRKVGILCWLFHNYQDKELPIKIIITIVFLINQCSVPQVYALE